MILTNNPFLVLDAVPIDDRARLMDCKENAILTHDEESVAQAYATLTHARKRTAAEINYLLDVPKNQIQEINQHLKQDDIYTLSDFLCEIQSDYFFNVYGTLAAQTETMRQNDLLIVMALFCQEFQKFSLPTCLDLINNYRQKAGISSLNIRILKEFLTRLLRWYYGIFDKHCQKLPIANQITVLKQLKNIDNQQANKEQISIHLFPFFVEQYEIRIQKELDTLRENIHNILDNAKNNNYEFSFIHINKLRICLSQWRDYVQPLTLFQRAPNKPDPYSEKLISRLLKKFEEFIQNTQQLHSNVLNICRETFTDKQSQKYFSNISRVLKQLTQLQEENEQKEQIVNLLNRFVEPDSLALKELDQLIQMLINLIEKGDTEALEILQNKTAEILLSYLHYAVNDSALTQSRHNYHKLEPYITNEAVKRQFDFVMEVINHRM